MVNSKGVGHSASVKEGVELLLLDQKGVRDSSHVHKGVMGEKGVAWGRKASPHKAKGVGNYPFDQEGRKAPSTSL